MSNKSEITLCSECLKSCQDKDLMLVRKLMFEKRPELGSYTYPVCKKCVDKDPTLEVAYSMLKPYKKNNKKIDVSELDLNLYKLGKPTRKGVERYLFLKKDGKEISLSLEDGLSRSYFLIKK